KMLYDNAQLLDLLTHVWQDTRLPLFERRIRETVDWLLREMRAPAAGDGLRAFAATIDADSEGEEGRFYVWSEAEMDALLGTDADAFKRTYDVTPDGNWEGKTILNRLHAPDLFDVDGEVRLEPARRILFDARAKRVAPGRDDKVLVDWNGLMIAALARAATAFQEPTWLEAAEDAFAFVHTHGTAEDGRLRHSWREGRLRHPATLDDYAQIARAAVVLYEATGNGAYLQRSADSADMAERHYGDGAGSYFMSADDTGGLITRPKSGTDNAVPSGNGTMAEVQARLWLLTGDPAWAERARRTIAAVSGEIE